MAYNAAGDGSPPPSDIPTRIVTGVITGLAALGIVLFAIAFSTGPSPATPRTVAPSVPGSTSGR